MRTVSYKSLLEGTLRLAGLNPSTAAESDKLKIMEFLAQALRQAHEHWRWPELTRIEERYFRDVWTPQSYDQDAEVYHEDTDAYYRATEDVDSSKVPGTDDEWEELETFNRYVDYNQEGMVSIEAVLGVWDQDPREQEDALPIDFETGYEGIRFAPSSSMPNSVWIEYRVRCPDFTYLEEWASGAYESGDQVYHPDSGEIYQAVDDVTTEIPGTDDEWVALEVPYNFATPCKRWAHALFAGSDGGNRKGLMTEEDFQKLLDEQVWQFTKLQGQTGRVTRRN